MKSITYVSKIPSRESGAAIPAGLSKMLNAAKRNNIEFGITGVLSYRKGYYIQVIEGKEDDVDRLFSNIMIDSRHKQVTLILETNVSERMFPNWNMRLLNAVNKEANFIKFIERHRTQLAAVSQDKLDLLGRFYTLNDSVKITKKAYQGKSLTLRAWPDFSLIKQSPTIIDLCATLTKQPSSYEDLLKSRQFGSASQLGEILDKFEALDILVIEELVDQNAQYMASLQSGGFYSKMKNFLGMR